MSINTAADNEGIRDVEHGYEVSFNNQRRNGISTVHRLYLDLEECFWALGKKSGRRPYCSWISTGKSKKALPRETRYSLHRRKKMGMLFIFNLKSHSHWHVHVHVHDA